MFRKGRSGQISIVALCYLLLFSVTSANAENCGQCETCDDHYNMCVAHCRAAGFEKEIFNCRSLDGCAQFSSCDCRGYVGTTTDPTGSTYPTEY